MTYFYQVLYAVYVSFLIANREKGGLRLVNFVSLTSSPICVCVCPAVYSRCRAKRWHDTSFHTIEAVFTEMT